MEHRLSWRRLARRPRRPRTARTVPRAPSGPSVSGYGEPHRYVLYLLYWAVPGATDIRDTEIHICQLGRRSIGVAVSHGGCDAPVPAVPLPIRSRDRGTTESSVIDTAPRGEGRGSICRGGRVRGLKLGSGVGWCEPERLITATRWSLGAKERP